MSFSSWDDGSWRRILKEAGEEEEEEEFVDHFGQQEGEVGALTEENIRARKEKADAEAAHRERIKEKRTSSAEDPQAEAERTATFGPKGIMGRKDDEVDLTENTQKKKPKKTDAEYLADYDQREREKQQEYAAQGKTYTGNTAAYDKAQAARSSGNWFTRNIQRGKDFKEKVADKVVRPLTGKNPNVRYGDQANFGRVAGDKGRGPLPRPSQILNVPSKVKQFAYDEGGKALGSASDAVTDKVGQVKQGVSQKLEGMAANRQAQKEQGAGKEAFISSGGGEMLEQLRTKETYPDAMIALTSKVNTLLTEATQDIMANKKPSNVNEIKEWMDMYQSAAPNSGETEKHKQIWEKILEASR